MFLCGTKALRNFHLFIVLMRRRRILRRVQRTKAPEVLFNRVVKRIHEFVLVTLFEATCNCRAVLEVQNRVPATSRSGQILCVRACAYFFCRPLLEQVDPATKGFFAKNHSKRGFLSECVFRTGSISCPAVSVSAATCFNGRSSDKENNAFPLKTQ